MPRPRSAARGGAKKAARHPLLETILSRPHQVGATLFFIGCAGIIAWNALALQRARHPAPLFSKGTVSTYNPAPPVRPAAVEPLRPAAQDYASPAPAASLDPTPTAAQVPAPASKPAQRSPIGDLIRNGGEVPAAQPARAAASTPTVPAPAAAPARPVTKDPIAEIIRMGGAVPVPPASVGKADADDVVFAGQRALAKMGYGVKVDGMFGPGTRQAIEAFERDRRLPVTGDFNARTIRELTAQTGIQIP
ncbi:peptidoglycan-binding domain-containing protein [Microvirga flavescens]|uniref:peptidoglycan-binding domain-containing protein n=1 Tax=Microvirga flavescens TaxID=2249811 RepID=UPI001300442F|nr:peptidoglycan-binding domain-containing protein [Microvirga flavescens]